MSRLQQSAGKLSIALHRVLGSRSGNRLGFLVYHRVQPNRPNVPETTFNVTPELFREQLAGLKSAGFRFVSMTQVLEARRNEEALPPRSVVVTFDDAFESVFTVARPILRELGIPAVAFLSTAYIGSSEPFPFDDWGATHRNQVPAEDYRPVNLAQCQQLLDEGLFELGAHTHTHRDLRGQAAEMHREIEYSVSQLRDWFDLEEVTFAFPFGKTALGYAGGELSRAARDAGAACALTTDCRTVDVLRDDPWQWGRFSATQSDSAATLAAKLAGWYGWATQLQVWIDRVRGTDRSADYGTPIVLAELIEIHEPIAVQVSP